MRVIISGAGEVGFHLAKLLAAEAHAITLIDIEKERLDYAENHLDVFTLQGDSTSFDVLHEAEASKADLLISVTSSEASNLTTTILGKKLGAKQTVARINKLEYLNEKHKTRLRELGIDELISPESLAAREVKHLLKESAVTESFEFDNGKLMLVGLPIAPEAPVVGKTVQEVAQMAKETHTLAVALKREEQTIIPHGNTVFQAHDHVFLITPSESMEEILRLVGKESVSVKNMMILGGSRTGRHTARRLSKYYNIKLIEQDREKCQVLADELPNTMIIHGDGTMVDILEEESIQNMDAFVAVTGNSETNIISCLVARNHGVKKTIAMVENIEYLSLSQSIGIDSLINKKLIAANFIFRYIRQGDIIAMTTIHGIDAEILEFQVTEKSKIIKKPIKDLGFPDSAMIGGVIRGNEGLIPNGNFQIQSGDRVVVFTLLSSLHKVERYF